MPGVEGDLTPEEKANGQLLANLLNVSVYYAPSVSKGLNPNPHMLDHLIDFDPDIVDADEGAVPVEKHSTAKVIDAQVSTADFLESLGSPKTETVVTELDQKAARKAFNAVVTQEPDAHHKLAKLETPEAVRHLVGMLTAYDWEFVQQAKEIRGYAVSKLLEECEHTNANIRLKALALLGKVTEVGLFTDKVEVKKADMTEDEIDRKLREKLNRFMNIADAEVIEDIALKHDTPTDDNQPTPLA
jgi:hypothetical protein